MSGAWLVGYLLAATVTGVVVGVEADDWHRVPDGSAPAIGVLAGLFWPLAWAYGIGWAVWRAVRGLGRSFYVLWDHTVGEWLENWRGRREAQWRIPRATARKAGGQ